MSDLTLADLVAVYGSAYTGQVFVIDDIILYVAIVLTVASMAMSLAMAPGAPKPPKSSSIDDFELPTAEAGRPIPLVFGVVTVKSPNIVWYGDLRHEEIKKEGYTVGYRYFMGMHLVICHGPVDALLQITMADREAWHGSVDGNQTISLGAGGLFGADDGEGGWSGEVEIRFGGPNQGPSPYLNAAGRQPNGVAHRGVLSVVCCQTYWGTTRYIKPTAWKVKRVPGRVWDAGTETWDVWYPEKAMIGNEANPAHILYEVLTNGEWGMGYPVGINSDARFREVADTLHGEGSGLGFVWVKQVPIQEFIQEIVNHISAALRLHQSTGQFEPKLIRADYDVATLPVFDDSNILELESFQRVGWGETVNEVVVKYRTIAGREQSVVMQNPANWQIQGRIVSETIDYPGVRAEALAKRLAARDLKVKSSGLAAVRFRANRKAHGLLPGDVFVFAWAALGIEGMVCRVGQVSGGTPLDGGISVEAAEDVFGLGTAVVSEVDDDEWSLPDPVPDPSTFDPPAAPSGLGGASGYQQVQWTWTSGEVGAKTELWVSQTNDRSTAIRVYSDYGSSHTQQAPGDSTWYGWVRAVDAYTHYSDWEPTGATGGVEAAAAGNGSALQPGAAANHSLAGGDVLVAAGTEVSIISTSIALSQPAGTQVTLQVAFDFIGSIAVRLVKLRIDSTWFVIYDKPVDLSSRFVAAQRFHRLPVPAGGAVDVELVVKHAESVDVLFESPNVFVLESMA